MLYTDPAAVDSLESIDQSAIDHRSISHFFIPLLLNYLC